MSSVVASSVFALLILDFSGSMSQVVDNEVKEVTMKKNISGFASSLAPQEKTQIIYFGTNPKAACTDIKKVTLPAEKLSPFIQSVHPGAFGKTPLAASFLRIPAALKENNFKYVTVLTDGADSCGQDPCQALLHVDSQLSALDKKINLFLIGYDLKESRQQMQCFLDLQGKLKNINLTTQFPDRKGNISSLLSQMRKEFPPAGFSLLEIAAAPADATFQLEQTQIIKTWSGSFQVVVPKGNYKLKFKDPDGKTITLQLGDRERKSIPFGALVHHPAVKVRLDNLSVQFTMKPTEFTLKAHPQAQFMRSEELSQKLIYFGTYDVEVTYPEWLRSLKKVQVEVPRRIETENLNLEKFFEQRIKLVPNSKSQNRRVFETMGTSYLVEPGQPLLPVPAQQKIEWHDAHEVSD